MLNPATTYMYIHTQNDNFYLPQTPRPGNNEDDDSNDFSTPNVTK